MESDKIVSKPYEVKKREPIRELPFWYCIYCRRKNEYLAEHKKPILCKLCQGE